MVFNSVLFTKKKEFSGDENYLCLDGFLPCKNRIFPPLGQNLPTLYRRQIYIRFWHVELIEVFVRVKGQNSSKVTRSITIFNVSSETEGLEQGMFMGHLGWPWPQKLCPQWRRPPKQHTVLRPLFHLHPGEQVLSRRDLLEQPLDFYEPDVLPATQPVMSKHHRKTLWFGSSFVLQTW